MSRSRRFTWWTLAGLLGVMVLAGCANNQSQSGSGGNGGVETSATEPPADKSVELVVNQGPSPRNQPLSRGSEESVAWQNNDDRGHTIRFTDWPFREPQQDVYVEAGQKSKKYHVYKGQDPGKYSYGVFPPVAGDSGAPGAQIPPSGTGPPDPPAVVVGD